MAIGKEIKVVLTLNDSGFKIGIRDAAGQLRNLEQQVTQTAKSVGRMENSMTSFGARAHRMIMTLGMARFALMDIHDIFLKFPSAVLKSSGEIERLEKLMEGLSTQSGETAKKLEAVAGVKFLFNMAQNAPFDVRALGDAFVKMKTGGIDPTNGSLRALVDGVARFGGSSEQLKRAAIAIQQMGGKGVVSMEELRQQLGEAVPTAMQAMATGMGISMAELTKRVSTGTVGAQVAIGKMLAVMSVQNAGAAAAMMDTWVGMLERLKTKWELFKVDIGKAGMFDEAKSAVGELIKVFDSDGARDVARSIGSGLASAVTAVTNFTKAVAEAWDTIVLAGKAFALYWGSARLAGMMGGAANYFKAIKDSAVASRDHSVAMIEDEKRARTDAIQGNVDELNRRIAGNDRLIAAERANVAAQKAASIEAMRAKVEAGKAEILAAKDKAAQLRIVEQQIRAEAMATALQAERIARSKKAGSGAEARNVMTDANRLTGNAEILARERAALTANAAAIEARNRALQNSISMAQISNNVTNGTIDGLSQKNNALRQVVSQHEAQARAISQSTSAMSMMRSVSRDVLIGLKDMVFSMNGLIAIIMAGVWAWNRFADAAKKAAREATTAIEIRDRLKRGAANDQDKEDLENVIKRDEGKLSAQQANIKNLKNLKKAAEERKVDTKDVAARLKAAEEEEQRLLSSLGKNRGALVDTVVQIERNNSERLAREVVEEVRRGANKLARKYEDATAELEAEISKGNVSPKRMEEIHAVKLDNTRKALLAQREYFKKELEGQQLKAADAGDTTQAAATAGEAVNQLSKEITNVDQQIANLARADQKMTAPGTGAGDKKKKAPVDALLAKMSDDFEAISKAKGKMSNMSADTIELTALREQANAEIASYLERNKDNGITNTPAQIEEAVDRLTNRKVYEEALREMRAIAPKLESSKEQLRQLEQQFATGNYGEAVSAEESAVMQRFEAINRLAPEIIAKFGDLNKMQRESLEVAGKTDLTKGLIDAAKRTRGLEIGNIIDARARAQAENAKEIQDVEAKYGEMMRLAMQYNGDVVAVAQLRQRELAEIEKRQAIAMRTPMEKMAAEWRDTYTQLNDMSAKWAQGFLDTLTTMLTTGRGDWKSFIRGMITDLANAQLKQALGGQITGMFDIFKNKIIGMMGVPGGAPAAGATTTAGAVGQTAVAIAPAATDAATKAIAQLGTKADAATEAMGTMTNDGIIGSTVAFIQSIFQTGMSTAAESVATSSMITLTFAAEAAAASLIQVAASSSASGGAGIFSAFGFANGGIMSAGGSLPLKKYANGGIANSPQLAIYGEGSMNEAYVPLPDGRTIPVTMKVDGGQGGAGQGGVMISIVVNEATGGETSNATGGDAQAWQRMANRVKSVVQEELVSQSRPGGILYK